MPNASTNGNKHFRKICPSNPKSASAIPISAKGRISAEGSGGHARLQVNFEGAGSNWLVA
jgi:hypothetical protein